MIVFKYAEGLGISVATLVMPSALTTCSFYYFRRFMDR